MHNFIKLLIVLAWVYALTYIFFDLPKETFSARLLYSVMSFIFSISFFYFVLTLFKKKRAQE